MSYCDKKRKWILPEKAADPNLIAEISRSFGLSSITSELVCRRGCSSYEEAKAFLVKNRVPGRSPFLLTDMEAAVDRIERALADENEIIAIYGDYDVDGVTSVSMLYLYLTSKGATVGYYIPSRTEEGYGMSCAAIDKLRERGVTLIITVDTGITAISEVAYARKLGIDVIVTDHHECRNELPDAVAVVNPHRPDCDYPFKELAGVGVTYKLVSAVEHSRALKEGQDPDYAEHQVVLEYADLVAIGTVADVMPIVDENRMIVAFGLAQIDQGRRKGIAALIEASAPPRTAASSKREINTSFIGFTIAPRLNAAGRMGNAVVAVELLLSDDDDQAQVIAERLCEINRERQTEENRIAEKAMNKIEADEGDDYSPDDKVIVLADDDWRQGVIGIVASRITEKYGLPSILVTFDGSIGYDGPSPHDVGKGSGRSIKGMNLVSALTYCEDLLCRYGGHELAAGLSVTRENLPFFRKKINEYAREQFKNVDLTVTLEADMIIEPEQITLDLARQLSLTIEPCGVGNATPVFVMRDATVISVRPVGNGKHLKISLAKNGCRFQAMYFGVSLMYACYDPGDSVDLMFSLGINHYAGETSVQLILNDIRFSENAYRGRLKDRSTFRGILNGDTFRESDGYLPDRKDFVNLYGLINDLLRAGDDGFTDRRMMFLINTKLPRRDAINFVKLRLLIRIFNELNIFSIVENEIIGEEQSNEWSLPVDYINVKKVIHKEKIDLESSVILQKLRKQCLREYCE